MVGMTTKQNKVKISFLIAQVSTGTPKNNINYGQTLNTQVNNKIVQSGGKMHPRKIPLDPFPACSTACEYPYSIPDGAPPSVHREPVVDLKGGFWGCNPPIILSMLNGVLQYANACTNYINNSTFQQILDPLLRMLSSTDGYCRCAASHVAHALCQWPHPGNIG